jgi:hypothetical protein
MKKIVLTFGLISGAVLAGMMAATLPFIDRIGFQYGELIGYTTMVVAFMLVFFGIRSYRETVGNGYITFGRAFKVGILIVLIASVCYVISWQIIHFNFIPDFADKYSAYTIEKSRAAGAGPEEIASQTARMEWFKAILQNPFYSSLVTLLEPLPAGLIITLISALILRKRPKEVSQERDLVTNT